MALVAQEKAERNPTTPWHKLLTVGAIFGALVALFNGWYFLTLPLFAILSGLANCKFPYTFYMAEVQRDPADVAGTSDEPARLSAATIRKFVASTVICFVLVLLRLATCGDVHNSLHEHAEHVEWMNQYTNLQLVSFEPHRSLFQVRS